MRYFILLFYVAYVYIYLLVTDNKGNSGTLQNV